MDVSSVAFCCHCPIGFTGPRCEFTVDWCRGPNVPCRHGATCLQVEHLFECVCAPGWTGTICDVMNVSCRAAAIRGEFCTVYLIRMTTCWISGNVGVFSSCQGNVRGGRSRQRELLYTMTLAAVELRKMYSDLCNPPPTAVGGGGGVEFLPPFVCLFFHKISQKPVTKLDTYKCSTMSSRMSFYFWGQKVRGRGYITKRLPGWVCVLL